MRLKDHGIRPTIDTSGATHYIRCPACRSLIPSGSTRCRMCRIEIGTDSMGNAFAKGGNHTSPNAMNPPPIQCNHRHRDTSPRGD